MRLRTLLAVGLAALVSGILAAHAQLPGVNSTLPTVFTYMYEASTNKPTYSAAMSIANGSVASSPTDVCSLQGSATRTIRVRNITVGGVATAVATEPVAILRRNAAPSAGTSIAFTPSAYDSSNSAATAIADVYTSNPAGGVGAATVLADALVTWGNFTTGVGSGNYTFTFGRLGSPVILRGTSQVLSVNLSGITSAGLNLQCTFEWTEYTDTAG